MSQYPYREASYRSTAHVDFEPPAWWAPHSSETHLLRETRATIGRMADADFMTWLDDRGREVGVGWVGVNVCDGVHRD